MAAIIWAPRMAETARTGVTDRHGRVHGTTNLYVAGGAVFPTSSQADPTFTIMLLALRLAQHPADGHTAGKTAAPAPSVRQIVPA